MVNLNQLAKLVTQYEGKKKQVNIAQVKEILRVLQQIGELDIDNLFGLMPKVRGMKAKSMEVYYEEKEKKQKIRKKK